MQDSALSPGRRRCLSIAARVACSAAALGSSPPVAARSRPRAPADDGLAGTVPPGLRPLLRSAGLPGRSLGLCIQAVSVDLAPLALVNAEQPYQLASTAKVVTTLAALDLLGQAYRWRTLAFLTGTLDAGRLQGDLVILGGGDALLRSEDLLQWFKQLRELGLQEVRGNIVLDRFAFRLTEADLASTPSPAPDRPHHAWPDALTVDEGRLRLRLQPRGAEPPRLSLQPAMPGLAVEAELSTEPGACELTAELARREPGQNQRRLLVRGRWSAECGPHEMEVLPWSHEEHSLRAVAALWRQAGGRLRGRVVAQARPAGPPSAWRWPSDEHGRRLQPFSVHRSDPLPELVRDINKTSDNLAARNLMLSLAPGFPMQAATLPGARARVQGWLQTQGLRPGDIRVDSGAGLSRDEQGKPRALVHLLRRVWQTPQRDVFVQSLPVAGVDGTLAHRMTRGRATGRAFLKTGTLLDTRALAGYVLGASGQTYAVAALVNHAEAQRATPMLDRLVEWVAAQG